MPRGDNTLSDRVSGVEMRVRAPYRRFVTRGPIRTTLGAALTCVALSLALLPAGGATASPTSGAAVESEPASKKKGPPPGATTKQIQQWVEAAIRDNLDCEPTNAYPCTLTMKWTPIKWLGTQRVCVEGVFGQPCLKYGTAYVARTDLLITTKTQQFDWQNNPTYVQTELTQYGWWDAGRKVLTYQPWEGGPTWKAGCSLDCGKDLTIRKDDLGRWFWGFGGAVYYLR